MCKKFVNKLILCLILVKILTYVQNQVIRNQLLKDRSIRQSFRGEEIAVIINIESYGTEHKDIDIKRNFSAPGRKISEIKCLEYIWDIIKKEILVRSKIKNVGATSALNCSERFIYVFHTGAKYINLRIIGGGRPALYGEFSHMGAVGWGSNEYGENKWVYKCGASLISDKFLLTAAHCSLLSRIDRSVYNQEPEVVKLGEKFIKNKYSLHCIDMDNCPTDFETTWFCEDDDIIECQIIRIDKFIKHPEYVSPRHYYDIALIELQEIVDFGRLIRPACLWNSLDTSAFENVTVSGWGETNPFTGAISDVLQVGDIGLIGDRFCDTLLKKKHNRKWRGLSDHQLCAGVLSGTVDTCRGDSGGPLQAKINISLRWPVYHLIGVTSFSYGCMRTNVPGIYVRVSSFVDWIESIVWPETT